MTKIQRITMGGISKFLLTCLLRGMTTELCQLPERHRISTHMPLARHDDDYPGRMSDIMPFLLTCLLRGMTPMKHSNGSGRLFLLTCLLRGMTGASVTS